MTNEDMYLFSELEDILEKIKQDGSGILSLPKALMCLCNKIRDLEYEIDTLKAKIPSD